MANTVMESIDVTVPVRTAYNQWTQFESFPRFMEGVERVDQLSPTRTHWVTKIGGVQREFDAEVTEQHPDERIAWKSDTGVDQAGVVTFHRIDDVTTRVTLQLEHEPQGVVEKAGEVLGAIDHRIKGDLGRFKSYIEERGHEDGSHCSPTGSRWSRPIYAATGDPPSHPTNPTTHSRPSARWPETSSR